jgi:cysteine desulfurase / selenocysteine lyase
MKLARDLAQHAFREGAPPGFDVERVRRDFPILDRYVHGRRLVYLDNAATTQKPRQVIEAMTRLYESGYANIHRGVHLLSLEATDAYESVREKVRRLINARQSREIVFVRGTTEAVNLVASSFGRPRVKPGDEILISALEHHSNIVPWQLLCRETGAKLRVIPMNDAGELLLDGYEEMLGPRTRIVAISHVSNALGTVNPVRQMIAEARRRGIPVLVDGAQAVPHGRVDVQALDCDFYAFSGHKVYGPTGVGVLYGKLEHLVSMPPYQGGGDMIASVTFEETTFNDVPYKFEAGTPNIAGVVGLGAAVDWLEGIGFEAIASQERDLLEYATAALAAVPQVRLVGTARRKASVLSFVVEGVHAHDVGTVLDHEGVAIRAGHHCAQPVMDRLGLPATARASFAVYNTREEADALIAGVRKVLEVFG